MDAQTRKEGKRTTKPIGPTPILTGSDAEQFLRETWGAKFNPEKERANAEGKRVFEKHRPR